MLCLIIINHSFKWARTLDYLMAMWIIWSKCKSHKGSKKRIKMHDPI
jgi:hypothetical protein